MLLLDRTSEVTMSHLWSRKNARHDLRAGLVLGVESIPDGLAAGLLAGVSGLFGS